MIRIYLASLACRERITSQVRRFLNNERGESSVMANIMMMAVAALIVIALLAFGRTALEWIQQKWTEITGG